MKRLVEMDLEYSQIIPQPTLQLEQLRHNATRNDGVTYKSWKTQWLDQFTKNHEKYGPFKEKSVASVFNRHKGEAAILIGSGPSLANNVEQLKDTKGVVKVSCLHNFHYLEDHDAGADYYLNLDAGPVTLEEVYEGGKHDPEHYWELSKDRVLVAWVGSHPELLARWKGLILFFNTPLPTEIREEMDKLEKFRVVMSTGGNVLGACFYFAKAILGCPVTIFTGADFCFSYTKKFHPWNSKYDGNIGNAVTHTDVFGNRVYTWQSYFNFKCWFDKIACTVPGIYINASEGGCLGSYAEGNIVQIMQMPLKTVLENYGMSEHLRDQMDNPEIDEPVLLFN